MAARDLWDLLQSTWTDRMGATAWDPPNLLLFEGAPWPVPTDAASGSAAGQAAPLPFGRGSPDWPNLVAGPAAAAPGGDAAARAQVLAALLQQAGSNKARAAKGEVKSDASVAAPLSFEDRWAEPSALPSPMPPYLIPIPENPPGVANVMLHSRDGRPSKYTTPSWPVGIGDNQAADQGPPSAAGDAAPWWLGDSQAVPEAATRPTPPLVRKGSILDTNGIDVANLVDAIISAESSGDTYAKPDSGNRVFVDRTSGPPYQQGVQIGKRDVEYPISSAFGAGQFLAPTWVGYLKANQADVIRENPWLDPAIRQNPKALTVAQASNAGLLDMRSDYASSRRATASLAEENAARLVKAHQAVTPGNLYLAHFLGPAGAIGALTADPNTPAEQVAGGAAALANRNLIKGKTIGELISAINDRVASAKGRQLPFR